MKKSLKVKDADFAKMERVPKPRNKYVSSGLHFYVSYGFRIFLMFASILVIAGVSYYCFDESFSNEQKVTMNYEETAGIDYDVKLFENNLFESGNLNAVDSYLSALVDDISTDINYKFSVDSESDITYTYRVDGIMSLKNNKDGDIISDKTFNLVPETKNTKEDVKNIEISQNINLDYDSYNKMAETIKNNHVSDINGNYKLKMLINVEIVNPKFEDKITKNQVIEVDIPLLSTQVSASMVDEIDNKDTYVEVVKPKLKNEAMLYIGVSLMILDTIFLLIALSFIFRTVPKKTKYCKLRDGLLSDYDKIIVNSKNIPETAGYNVIDCYSFSELMDAQRLLSKPIVYHEIVKNQKCIFMIVGDNDVYKFVLKECDIDF